MFDYDPEGRLIILADGAEVLVHHGGTGAPLWRHTEEADLVGVASLEDAVVTLDVNGRLALHDPQTGGAKGEVRVGGRPRAFAVTEMGVAAIAAEDEVILVRSSGIWRRLDVRDPSCVAWTPDGGLGVGTRRGQVLHFADDDEAEFQTTLPGPVTALTWNPQGFWAATTAAALYSFEPEETRRITGGPDDMPISALACSPGGDYIAVLMGETLVLVLEYPSRETDAQVRYHDRAVSGLRFGPHPWLGIGLEGGDGNRINLVDGATHRTDTHPGRAHNSWMLSVNAERDEDRPPTRIEHDGQMQANPMQTAIGWFVLVAIGIGLYFLL